MSTPAAQYRVKKIHNLPGTGKKVLILERVDKPIYPKT